MLTADSFGATILASMEGMSVSKHKFSRKMQVTNLASSVYVCADGEKIEILSRIVIRLQTVYATCG